MLSLRRSERWPLHIFECGGLAPLSSGEAWLAGELSHESSLSRFGANSVSPTHWGILGLRLAQTIQPASSRRTPKEGLGAERPTPK